MALFRRSGLERGTGPYPWAPACAGETMVKLGAGLRAGETMVRVAA